MPDPCTAPELQIIDAMRNVRPLMAGIHNKESGLRLTGGSYKTVDSHDSLNCCGCFYIYKQLMNVYNQLSKPEFAEVSNMWNKLYNAAVKVQNSRTISPFIEAGGVAAAILTKQGNIYVGVCIDTACTLGMCAERNAIANMITNGESQIDKVVAVMPDGRVGSPCGACREYMMQLDKDSGDIEILLDLETQKTVRLKELVPDWWGYDRFGE